MTSFAEKNSNPANYLGEQLRLARQKKGVTLAEASKKIHIRQEYLQALENNDHRLLPSGLYGRQFLKEYCRYLQLNIKKIIKHSPPTETASDQNPFSQKILRKSKFFIFPRLIRNLSLALLFIICLLYLLIYFRRLIMPPKLALEYPDKNLFIFTPNLEIRGYSEPETEIKINEKIIMSTQDGHFIQEIKLKNGLNNVIISAKKKYGQASVIQRQILVENKYEQSE